VTPSQLEAKVLTLVDAIRRNQRPEGSVVEFKRQWPDEHAKAARGIAGLANAARGEPVIWVIGIDEKTGDAFDADPPEFANWWPKVQSCFEGGFCPSLRLNLSIADSGVSIVALYFETNRPPYVVKNAVPGQIDFEVPWREGNRTRSAKRADLLRLLYPTLKALKVTVRGASLRYYPAEKKQEMWRVFVDLGKQRGRANKGVGSRIACPREGPWPNPKSRLSPE
jgi:hypothetical protein